MAGQRLAENVVTNAVKVSLSFVTSQGAVYKITDNSRRNT